MKKQLKEVQSYLVKKTYKNVGAGLDQPVFIMKYYLELTNNEIANTLGLTKAAVDNRLYRGKKELAQHDSLKERFI